MRTNNLFRNGFFIPRIATALCLVLAAIALTFYSFAANPPSGTLSASTPGLKLTYTTGPNVVSNPSGQAGLVCNAAVPCDDYLLTVDATGFVGTHNVVITIQWPVPAEDYDVYVHQGQNPPGPLEKTAASSADPEIVILDAVSEVYTIRVVPFAVAGSTFTGTIEFVAKATSTDPLPPGPGTPRYHNFAATGSLGNSAGEPTLGPGPAIAGQPGGRTMFIAGLETLRTTWNDCSSPASGPGFPGTFTPATSVPLWEDKSFATTSVTTLDPILFTDFATGRTFVSQLGPKTSFLAFTDNDGGEDADTSDDYTPSQGSGINSGVDHQNIGAGPYNPNGVVPPHPLYANAVYYASQDVAVAQMARSDTGGLTFGAAIPMYNLTQCGGLHGHIKVTPSNAVTLANGHAGTVYNPNKGCGTNQGVVVSEDNGLNFVVRTVPGSSPGDTDPSLGIDAAGTIYFAFADGDGHAKVAVSTNKGSTWSTPVDVGAPFGIKNTVFPGAVGGDAGRATVMYLATDTGGGYEATGVFPGVWHIYASHTFDGGATWTTVRVTPANDPVQRGSICTSGTGCMGGDRNLLDFNDVEIDHEGRVIIAYADGCVGCTSTTGNDSRADKATIARQSGGRRMLAAFDPNPAEPAVPASPRVNEVGEVAPGNVHLAWSEPDNGSSALTGYNVYRRTDPGTYGPPLATVTLGCPTCKTTYDDLTAVPDTAYFYKVTALNAIGQGTNCGEFPIGDVVGGGDDPCFVPGPELLTDPAGDTSAVLGLVTTPAPPGSDLLSFQLSQPFAPDDDLKLVFTINTDPGESPQPPGSAWYVAMQIDGATYKAVHMAWRGTTPAFESYTPGPNNAGGVDGRFVEPGTEVPAEPESNYSPPYDKVVIVVKASQLGLSPDDALKFVSGVTFSSDPLNIGAGVTGLFDEMPDGLAFTGSYTVKENQTCRPNIAPIAALTADTIEGEAPLLVNFDASGSSDADTTAPPDTIASYTFNFGDGSAEVTQATPTIQHTYAEDGNYPATVRVTDSRGKPSDNAAQVVIQVDPAPNPTPTPNPSATPTPDPSATPTATPSPTASGSPTATPTPAPTPTKAKFFNISTRVRVGIEDEVGIAGFIVRDGDSKKVIVRGIGPSIQANNTPVPGRMENPRLELFNNSGVLIDSNDDWRSSNESEIQASQLAPTDDKEAAIIKTLAASAHTAVLSGVGGTQGVALVEVYDLEGSTAAQLANISTRGKVATGDDVLIGGIIVRGGSPQNVLVRGMGPSLAAHNVSGPLNDPELELRDQNGALLMFNQNWKDEQRTEIEATGIAPADNRESAILRVLDAGNYTAIVRGRNNTQGMALVEAYNLGDP